MAAAEGPGGEELRLRLVRMMAARLVLSLAVFVFALAVAGVDEETSEAAGRGLYGTLAVAFSVSALYAAALRFVRRWRRFAAVQIATDVAVVTSLVAFSGGAESVFSFLYLPVAVVGALLLGRPGAYGSAVMASLGYGGVLAAGAAADPGAVPPPEVLWLVWGVHTGALLLVALLASVLASDLRVAGQRLHERTDDLRRLRRLHGRIVESLTSGLLTVDREGRITSFNPEAERIVGRSAEAVQGCRLDEVLPGAGSLVGQRIDRAVRDRNRLRFVNHGGEERHLGLASSILRDVDGTEAGHVVIFQDVTEVVAMERSLRRSERLAGVGQLAADIAHEIRNPLAAISGSVEMLRSGLGEGEADQERRRLMEIVLREIERLNGLITDFLQYARPAPPKLESQRLAGIVEELATVFGPAVPQGVRLEVEVSEDAVVVGDASQLRQMLWNLVGNAVQALGAQGRVRIAAARRRQEAQAPAAEGRHASEAPSAVVEVRVEDDGCGMALEQMERIFDPFFTTKRGGTGLGLATVHRIVENHGGSIHVESSVGEGTCFRILLPAAEETS